MSEAKKGFSIWSLLVIMTLAGLLLGVGSLLKFDRTWSDWVLFTSRQIALCGLTFSVIWFITGRRKTVAVLSLIVMVVMWGPLVFYQFETSVSNSSGQAYIDKFLMQMGVYSAYHDFYMTVVTNAYE